MKTMLFAGSFNPYTIGHHSVYKDSCKLFGRLNVVLGITQNPSKPEQNLQRIRWTVNPIFKGSQLNSSFVQVVDKPLLADYATEYNITGLIRSMRNSIDLVNEVNLSTWNKSFGVPTVFVPSDEKLSHVSSTAIRELDKLGKDVSEYFVNKLQYDRWKAGKPKRVIVVGEMGCGKTSFLEDWSKAMSDTKSVDMDKVMKHWLPDSCKRDFGKFFDETITDDIIDKWENEVYLKYPKQKVVEIVNKELTFHPMNGIAKVYEMSSFTAYDLEHLYKDSIIVYVQRYSNGKKRDIDSDLQRKCLQLQKMPEVVDYIIDQRHKNQDVSSVVMAIRECLLGDD